MRAVVALVASAALSPGVSFADQASVSSLLPQDASATTMPVPERSSVVMTATQTKTESESAQQPHVLMIVADDLGWNDVGFNQNRPSSANQAGRRTTQIEIRTPVIDRLASESAVLSHYYVQPICSPTRAAFMTGRYPVSTGIRNVIRPNAPYGVPGDEVFLPQKFKEAGYSTHAVGKWHLGLCDPRYLPTFRGFDSFTGLLAGGGDYFEHTRAWAGHDGFDLRASRSTLVPMEVPPPKLDANGTYNAYVFANAVHRVIKERVVLPRMGNESHDQLKPTFVYVAFQSVHEPLQAPQAQIERYPSEMGKERRVYAAMVSVLDEAVGTIEKTYKDAVIWDSTITIFTTDNGGWVPYGASNFPLRGQKNTWWEGGVRGVAFVRGTSADSYASAGFAVPAGVRGQLMHATDWLPTLGSVAGFSLSGTKPRDGVDQWRTIAQNVPTLRTSMLIDAVDGTGAIRDDRYKLVVLPSGKDPPIGTRTYREASQAPPPGFIPDQATVCASPEPLNGTIYLFDVRDDPQECINQAVNMPEKLHELVSLLKEYEMKAASPSIEELYAGAADDPEAFPDKRDDKTWGPWALRSGGHCPWPWPDPKDYNPGWKEEQEVRKQQLAWQSEPAAKPPLQWVHIPKNGQSFAITFYAYACPACASNITEYLVSHPDDKLKVLHAQRRWQTEGCCDPKRLLGWDRHPMGHEAASRAISGHIAVVLRDPAKRMLSDYEYFAGRKVPPEEWLRAPGAYDCQTAFLLGGDRISGTPPRRSPCPSHAAFTDGQVREAVQMVQDERIVPFVGILEYWDASVALFHAKFFGDDTIDPRELENIHPTRPTGPGSEGEADSDEPAFRNITGAADQAVYDAALLRFKKEAALHAAQARRLMYEMQMRTRPVALSRDFV